MQVDAKPGEVFILNGKIDRAMAVEFAATLAKFPVRSLIVTSDGGDIVAAMDMGDLIYKNQIDIYVPYRCNSSCANYLFTAARHKYLGDLRVIGWQGSAQHGDYLLKTQRHPASPVQRERVRLLTQKEFAFFKRIGVDGFVSWVGKLRPFSAAGRYSLSLDNLAYFGIQGVKVYETAPDSTPSTGLVNLTPAAVEALRAGLPP